jgi:hypothetical protein
MVVERKEIVHFRFGILSSSVTDPGCLSWIPDTKSDFSIPDPGSGVKKIPDPDPHKKFNYLNAKIVSQI